MKIKKYGLDKFIYYIYEYFTYEDKDSSFKLLTDLETMYINLTLAIYFA